MTIQLMPHGSETVAILVGELTLDTLEKFLPTFVELSMQGWNDIVLDMTGIHLMDTVGAGLLLALRDRLETQGLDLRLSCPQPGPLQLMEQVGLLQTLRIEMTAQDGAVLH